MKKGFTIVELLIYMGLAATMLVILTDIFVAVLNVQSESSASSNVETDGRFILARLAYDVGRAGTIVNPATLGQTTNNTATVNIGGVNYSYDGSTGDLLIGTDKLNGYGTQISNLTFTRLGNAGGKNDLQIKFRLTSRITQAKGPETKDFQITIGQR